MKTIIIISQNNKWTGLYVAVSLLVFFSSCVSSKTDFLTSPVIPAARGYVKVNKDKQENYIIQVSIEHLAEAERLDPSKETYVIWMESDQNSTKNIGQINSNSHSNKLKATFETASSFEPTRIYITAEDEGTASYPWASDRINHGQVIKLNMNSAIRDYVKLATL